MKAFACLVASVLLVFAKVAHAVDDQELLSDLDHTLLKSCQDSYKNLKLAKDELFSQYEFAQKTIQSLQSEKDLISQEVSILEERIQVCDATSKAHQSRESICKQDREILKTEIAAYNDRIAAMEREARQSDCIGVKKDLQVYRARAEQAEIEKEVCSRKLRDADSRCKGLPALENSLKEAENRSLDCSIDKKVLSAELKATKETLSSELKATKDIVDALITSLASHDKYESLQRAHEQGIARFVLLIICLGNDTDMLSYHLIRRVVLQKQEFLVYFFMQNCFLIGWHMLYHPSS